MQKVELAAARAPQGEWITEHKNLMATIHQQDVELQKKVSSSFFFSPLSLHQKEYERFCALSSFSH